MSNLQACCACGVDTGHAREVAGLSGDRLGDALDSRDDATVRHDGLEQGAGTAALVLNQSHSLYCSAGKPPDTHKLHPFQGPIGTTL